MTAVDHSSPIRVGQVCDGFGLGMVGVRAAERRRGRCRRDIAAEDVQIDGIVGEDDDVGPVSSRCAFRKPIPS